jgi:S1-C subfamily serine protease
VLLLAATPALAQPTPATPPAESEPASIPEPGDEEPTPPDEAGEAPPLPPTDAPPESGCDGEWFIRVYRGAYRSVVRIDTAGGLGAGFVFHSPRHVATAFHVVSLGRAVEVTFADGTTMAAEVVAVDKENDLAILELYGTASAPPLEPGETDQPDLGTPVLAIGHPYATVNDELEGLLSWSVSQGIVSGRGERLLQTDAALNPGNSGGPLLGCDGRLLGVVSAKLQAEGIGFVIPSRLLVALTPEIDRQPPFLGDWSISPGLGMMLHANPREALLGFEVSLGVEVIDRWEARLRYGSLWAVAQQEQPPEVFSRAIQRHALGLDAGYRFMLRERPFPVYLGLFVGGAATRTQINETHLTGVAQDPACTGTACSFQVQRTDMETADWMGYPVVGFHLEIFGGLDLSYAFLPDVTDIELSLHRALLGVTL